jgi:hypothetical protein
VASPADRELSDRETLAWIERKVQDECQFRKRGDSGRWPDPVKVFDIICALIQQGVLKPARTIKREQPMENQTSIEEA